MRLFIIAATLLTGIFSQNIAYAENCEAEISAAFKGKQGCFLLYNQSKDRYETIYGGTCDTRVSPASTFKIANSLIGLDLGILADDNTLYKWDGNKQTIKEHERDHTLASAVKFSVVWYFQRVAEQVGEQNYNKYLEKFSYGNKDISGGLTSFWLGKSLKISPKEQIEFLNKLYRNQLPVSIHANDIVKKILVLESTYKTTLSGKTGSASADGTNIGWFVGHISAGGEEYNFATTLQVAGTDYKIDNIYAGIKTKEVTKEIISCLKIN